MDEQGKLLNKFSDFDLESKTILLSKMLDDFVVNGGSLRELIHLIRENQSDNYVIEELIAHFEEA